MLRVVKWWETDKLKIFFLIQKVWVISSLFVVWIVFFSQIHESTIIWAPFCEKTDNLSKIILKKSYYNSKYYNFKIVMKNQKQLRHQPKTKKKWLNMNLRDIYFKWNKKKIEEKLIKSLRRQHVIIFFFFFSRRKKP